MKTLDIAVKEFRSFFFSPIAWLLLAVFVIQVSKPYLDMLAITLVFDSQGYEGYPFTPRIFTPMQYGPLAQLSAALIVFVPLLTMGLLSREYSNGSIRLLLSSPVATWKVILGKYLSVVLVLVVMCSFLYLLAAMTGYFLPHLDYGLVTAGILGIFLLGAAYGAVGLFMSSLTAHQFVAAVGTMALLTLLTFADGMGQRVPVLDEIAYWFSIDGRFDLFRRGLVASKDVVYLILIVALFLSWTHVRLSSGRRSGSALGSSMRYVGVFVLVAAMGYVSSLPALTSYKDMTQTRSMTLAAGTQAAIAGIDDNVRLTLYINVLDQHAHRYLPERRKSSFRRTFEQFERGVGSVDVSYQYYYASTDNQKLYDANPGLSAEDLARDYALQNRLDFDNFLSEADIQAIAPQAAHLFRNFYVLQWQDQREVLRIFRDMKAEPGETETGGAFGRMTAGPVKVGYVSGHGERNAFEKGVNDHFHLTTNVTNRNALSNQGFDFENVSLDAGISDAVDILVLAGPTTALGEDARRHLTDYIASGRSLFMMIEPDTPNGTVDLMREFGIATEKRVIAANQADLPSDIVFGLSSDKGRALGIDPIYRKESDPVIFSAPVALSVKEDAAVEGHIVPIVTAAAGEDGGLPRDEQVIGFGINRYVNDTEQRIVVVGDADFMSIAMAESIGSGTVDRVNEWFLHEVMRYLSFGRYPVDVSRALPLDTEISLETIDLEWLKYVLLVGFPLIIVSCGGIVLIRRRAK